MFSSSSWLLLRLPCCCYISQRLLCLMDTLIKRKNLRAGQGKKRWRRNIDVTALQEKINERPLHMPTRQQAATISYTVDASNADIYANKERFKKQPIDSKLLSKREKKLIKLYEKRVEVCQTEQPETLDIWGDYVPKQKPELDRPAFIVKPLPGQSYHPSEADHEKLLDKVVADELRSQVKVVAPRTDKTERIVQLQYSQIIVSENARRERLKLRNLERRFGKAPILALEERQKAHSFTLINQLKREERAEKRRLQQRQTEREEEKVSQAKAFKEGRLVKPRKMGKKMIALTTDDFLVEVPEVLRKVEPKDTLLRNHFESFYRRGLLEPKNPSNSLRSSKFPKYRIKKL